MANLFFESLEVAVISVAEVILLLLAGGVGVLFHQLDAPALKRVSQVLPRRFTSKELNR